MTQPLRAKGPIEQALDALPRAFVAKAKGEAHCARGLRGTFTLDGLTITVISGPTPIPNGFQVVLAAERGGVPIPIDNPCLFVNPPIVHEGREDVEGAYQRILADVVLASESAK